MFKDKTIEGLKGDHVFHPLLTHMSDCVDQDQLDHRSQWIFEDVRTSTIPIITFVLWAVYCANLK